MQRVKTFDATGVAPGGRLFAGDLNAIQDAAAGLTDLTQVFKAGEVHIGENGLAFTRVGAGRVNLAGELDIADLLKPSAALVFVNLTTTQRDALASGKAPKGSTIYNTTLNCVQCNIGTDGSRNWINVGTPARGSALPGSPVDGQEYHYIVDDTNGIEWHLVYDASQVKWRYVGGPPLRAAVDTSENIASASGAYQDFSTVGPAVTTPLTGSYFVRFGDIAFTTTVNNYTIQTSIDIAGGGASDADAIQRSSPASTSVDKSTGMMSRVKSLTAANVVTMKYKAPSAVNITVATRWLEIVPIFVS